MEQDSCSECGFKNFAVGEMNSLRVATSTNRRTVSWIVGKSSDHHTNTDQHIRVNKSKSKAEKQAKAKASVFLKCVMLTL